MKTFDSSTVIQRFVGTLSSWRSWGSKWDAVLIWEFTECCRPCKSPHLTMKESFIKRFLCFNFQELFIYLLFGHTHGMCQFLGQGSNLCHSSNLSCHSDRQHGILNLLHTRELLRSNFNPVLMWPKQISSVFSQHCFQIGNLIAEPHSFWHFSSKVLLSIQRGNYGLKVSFPQVSWHSVIYCNFNCLGQ